MHWTEPATADDSHAELEKKLWDAANPLWSGADLRPSEYAILESRTLASLLKTMASISIAVPIRNLSRHSATTPDGLSGDIKQGITYHEDLQDSVGRIDFVLATPPFNVCKIDKERLAGDPRYPFGIPRTDNGNYLWIQHFHSALDKKGRAGFVMANSAADARASEQEIREKIIRAGHVDVMVAIGPFNHSWRILEISQKAA